MKILQILNDCVKAAVKTDKLLFSKTDEDGYMLMTPDGLVMYKVPRVNVPFTFDGKCSPAAERIRGSDKALHGRIREEAKTQPAHFKRQSSSRYEAFKEFRAASADDDG